MTTDVARSVEDISVAGDRLQIGKVTVHRVADLDRIAWPIEAMFGNDANHLTSSARDLLPPDAVDPADNRLLLSFNVFAVRTPDFTCLVDAGLGNDKERHDRPA